MQAEELLSAAERALTATPNCRIGGGHRRIRDGALSRQRCRGRARTAHSIETERAQDHVQQGDSRVGRDLSRTDRLRRCEGRRGGQDCHRQDRHQNRRVHHFLRHVGLSPFM